MGLSGSVKQLKGLIIISKGLEEKLKVFSLGAWGWGVAVVYILFYCCMPSLDFYILEYSGLTMLC